MSIFHVSHLSPEQAAQGLPPSLLLRYVACVPDGPVVFATGSEANDYRALMSRLHPNDLYRVVRVDAAVEAGGVSWQEREASRFESGAYSPLPWDSEVWFDRSRHYAHVSKLHPGKLAFTVDAAKGAADIQTSMSPGRYLTRYFADALTAPEIGTWAATLSDGGDDDGFRLAGTPDDIERVYKEGPRSCMVFAHNEHASSVHPCRIYGAGDLAIAYLERDGDITARVLCWPERHLYCRIYGDETRLFAALERRGYTNGSLDGARLLMIPQGDGYVMPYLDRGGACFHSDGRHLQLTLNRGELEVHRTDGCTEEEGQECEDCGNHYPEEQMYWIEEADRTVCDNCVSDYPHCESCGERSRNELTTVHMMQGRHMHREEYCIRCLDGSYFHFVEADGEYYHADMVFMCHTCDEACLIDDDSHVSEHDDETRCECCHASHEQEIEEAALEQARIVRRSRVGVRRRLSLLGGVFA